MLLWLTSHADSELVAMALAHQFDQIRTPQAIVGEISSEGQDIAQTLLAALVQNLFHLLLRRVSNGEVHLDWCLRVVLQP